MRFKTRIPDLAAYGRAHVRTATDPVTPVDVTLERANGAVRLSVADDGPGMTAEQAEHVFERFYRGDQARTRKAGGTGLGLAIVAALVTAHGGTVALRTAPGQGATFQVTLPLAPEAQRDASADDESFSTPS